MSYRLPKQTADTQTILQPNTPAYHTSEQTTLQTPDSLCLDPHTTLANTYDNFRVTTYDLQLPSFLLGLTTTSSLSLSSISLSSQPTLTAISELRLTTYDFPALLYWDPPPPTTNNHQQSLTQFNCSLRLVTTRLTFNRSLRLTTYDFLAGTHHHQQPPAASQH